MTAPRITKQRLSIHHYKHESKSEEEIHHYVVEMASNAIYIHVKHGCIPTSRYIELFN